MSLATVKRIFKDTVTTGGLAAKALLAANYPDDFQYQFVALELTDYSGKTLDLLAFPILPSQITDSRQASLEIKKTATGVVTHYNPHFVPHDLAVRGTFGRSFKILVGRREFSGSAYRFNPSRTIDYDFSIKNGYGVSKVMEKIINGSRRTDDQGRSNLLFFYNSMRNANYIVEVTNERFEQNESKNDLINYSLQMKAVAPASASLNKTKSTSLINLFAQDIVGKTLTDIGYGVLKEVSKSGKILLREI